jgi:hypothetical protein
MKVNVIERSIPEKEDYAEIEFDGSLIKYQYIHRLTFGRILDYRPFTRTWSFPGCQLANP